ncbi:MAG: peptide deformylase [Clostridia bacterium]|nr:peptide deformylase [Clostridia bacterium]
MALRNIITDPDSRLRKISRPVKEITPHIITLLDDMAETMKQAEGVGLAAPQVGVLRRVVVIDVGEGLIELINPEIISQSGKQKGPEACLSVEDRKGLVERPNKVTVKALDREGNERIIEGEGLLARCLCHEIDHLDGILYIDKMEREMELDEEYEENEEA